MVTAEGAADVKWGDGCVVSDGCVEIKFRAPNEGGGVMNELDRDVGTRSFCKVRTTVR